MILPASLRFVVDRMSILGLSREDLYVGRERRMASGAAVDRLNQSLRLVQSEGLETGEEIRQGILGQ